MEAASLGFSVRLFTVCLLGAARISCEDKNDCSCPKIPLWERTKPPPDECRPLGSTFRHSCEDGYVRKAGTSNRIKCVLKDGVPKWETPNLECIDDPRKPNPPPQDDTKSHTDISQTSILNTTSTAPSTTQKMIWRTGTSPSEAGKTNSMRSTPHDSVPQTTGRTLIIQTSTLSRSATKSDTNSLQEGLGDYTKAAIISSASLVIVCALIGIGCTLYRRRSINSTPLQPVEELVPMNHAPPGQSL